MTLEVFVKHPRMDAYRVGGAYQPYAIVGRDKRFSDAELMAEVWMQYWGAMPFRKEGLANTRGKSARLEVINRFAQLPHASDTNYE